MRLLESRLLAGPNLHAAGPVLVALLDLEDLEGVASTDLPGFTEALLEALPGLAGHRCSTGHTGGFAQRLHGGTHLAHITEHVALELQCRAGHAVGYGRARRVRGRPGLHRVVVACRDGALAVAALDLAVQAVAAMAATATATAIAPASRPIGPSPRRLLDTGLTRLREQVRRTALGPSTQAIVDAARQRGIPVLRMSERASLFQLGWGAQQQRVQATLTGLTSHIAVHIASDKALTKRLLDSIGLPVPHGSTVATAEAAVAAAAACDGPVALKPLDGNQGKGVSTGVQGEASVRAAFERAVAFGRRVIVERHVEGHDHRVLVVGGMAVAASRRVPPEVCGDGRRSVRALVDALNADPRRGDGHGSAMTRVCLDNAALDMLAAQGLDADAVPATGHRVRLRSNANLSTGGSAQDVTASLHPDTAADCVRAARRIGLDVAGIDLVCRDIGQPLAAQGGAIIEVNAAPGIRMHEHPGEGARQHVGRAIVASLFGADPAANGRIPVVAVAGSRGKTTTAAVLAQVLQRSGRCTGLACSDGLWVGGRRLAAGAWAGPQAADMLLQDPGVEVAVLETGPVALLQQGLGVDRCDAVVLLNALADLTGTVPGRPALKDDLLTPTLRTPEARRAVHGMVLSTARRLAVLNADDPGCVALAARVRRRCETLWIGRHAANPVLAQHLAQGGRAVFCSGDLLVWADGTHHAALLEVGALPAALGSDEKHRVVNGMAALAVLLGLGLSGVQAAAGLASLGAAMQAAVGVGKVSSPAG